MKLSIGDRINILQILPKKGSYLKLVVIEDLQKKIGITQDEIVKHNIITKDNEITWQIEKEINEFDFKKLEIIEIESALIELSKANELTADTFNLYKLFEIKE